MANEFIARNGVISKGNVVVTGSLTTSGSLTTTGTITATTLVVQTVTSSISAITGSTNFGSLSTNTHTFTGSILTSGSIGVNITNPSVYSALAVSGAVSNSIARVALTAIGASNGINIGDDGTDAVIGPLNSATKLHILSRSGGVYTRALTVDSSGNVGIGTTSPDNLLNISGNTGAMKLEATTTNRSAIQIFNTANNLYVGVDNSAASYFGYVAYSANIQTLNYPIIFSNGSGAPTEKLRITSDGWTKISNNGTYTGVSSTYHEIVSTFSNNAAVVVTNKASSNPYGVYIIFTGASPNDITRWFWNCEDSTATRAYMRSNGGLVNYQANNTNLSDIRTKKDISALESYWDKFKAIEVVKFKYKDQTHDGFNIGVIAQQVEEIAPEFIDVEGFGNKTPEDGVPLKTIYTTDMYHATIKVLQEAMAKIETLETEIEELKARI